MTAEILYSSSEEDSDSSDEGEHIEARQVEAGINAADTRIRKERATRGVEAPVQGKQRVVKNRKERKAEEYPAMKNARSGIYEEASYVEDLGRGQLQAAADNEDDIKMLKPKPRLKKPATTSLRQEIK